MKNVIAYWLLPEESQRAVFSEIIRDLAQRYDAVQFDPHLTIFIAPEDESRPATEVLPKIAPFCLSLSTTGIHSSDKFTKTLFVQFNKTKAVQKLADSFQRASGTGRRYIVNPHLSLLYQQLTRRTKRELAATIELPLRRVRFTAAVAVRCPSPTRTVAQVRAWRVLARQNSSTR